MSKIKEYRKKEPVLVIKWDGKDDTLELIRKKLCSKVQNISACGRCESDKETLFTREEDGDNLDAHCNTFYQKGDYVVFDSAKNIMRIRSYDKETLDRFYTLI